jgi:monoamine oxidase
MSKPNAQHIIVIGAGAAGLMAARELGRAGRRVTLLEARDRCGGRIYPLPDAEFGYAAEGGAEFVHGEAPVTHGLLREAGLKLLPIQGTPWTIEDGKFLRRDVQAPHQAELQKALQDLTEDLTVAEFLRRHFASPLYGGLRRSIERMAEGYDAIRKLVAARAINWAHDTYAGGAYSYATPGTRGAQAVLSRCDGGTIFFSGEALYRGRDMGTVEAALASGLETARALLG